MKDGNLSVKPWVRAAAVILTAVAVSLTVTAVHHRGVRAGDRELLRIGAEDVARRVRSTTANLVTVIEASNAALLAKVRALQELVSADPSLVEDQARVEALAKKLAVDEIHVSDDKGVLIRSFPASFAGFDLGSKPQSRPFLAALTDPAFALVQEPMEKGADGTRFQYAGVARLDRPGVLQVGQYASRVDEARKLADVAEIVKSARIGREGRVSIIPLSDTRHGAGGLRIERLGGERQYVLPADVGGYRILARIPVYGSVLADEVPFFALCVIDAFLVCFLLILIVPSCRGIAAAHVRSLAVLFTGAGTASASAASGRSTFFRMLTNPLTLTCAVAFALATYAFWAYAHRAARRAGEETLQTAAADMRNTIDDCVDQPLFYLGNAICKHYGSPGAVKPEDVADVMGRYDIDELNVIDSRGIVVAGAIADLGYDMASNPKSAEFNRLLAGVSTYSQDFRGAIENPTLRRKYVGVAFPPPAKGYIQIGFSEARVKDGIDYWFKDLARGRHVGESGFYVVAKSETGEIDSCGTALPDGADTLAAVGFDISSAPKDGKTAFTARLCGIDCLCLTEELSHHRVITALPLTEVNAGIGRATAYMGGILVAVLLVVSYFMTRLSGLVESLKGYIASEKTRQEKEFALARVVQTSSLPLDFPDTDSFSIVAKMVTAKEVGGDFYDFYRLPSGKQLVLVADVSGKGISAAMFMMKARTIIKSCVTASQDLAAAIVDANNRLSRHNEAEMFVTAWIAVVDMATGEVEYVNAGHNPPLVKRADGSVEWIRGNVSLVLAAMEGVPYRSERFSIRPGDRLFLYTDGVTEAMNGSAELFGEPRLEAVLRSAGPKPAEDVQQALHAFVNGAEQSDDITMLSFAFKRPETK